MIPELPPDLCTAAIPAPAATERLCVQPSRTELPSSPSRSAVLRPQPPGRSPRCAQLSPARPGPAGPARGGARGGKPFRAPLPGGGPGRNLTPRPRPTLPEEREGPYLPPAPPRPAPAGAAPTPAPAGPRAAAAGPCGGSGSASNGPARARRGRAGAGGGGHEGGRGAGLAACWAASALVPLWPGWCVRGEAAVGRARPELRGEQHSAAWMPS